MANNNSVTGILELNETLKNLNHKTSQISLIALNAMLMARKENSTKNGFSVVTTELRKFCAHLGKRTELLSGYIFRIVIQMSELEKLQHNHRIILETCRLSQKVDQPNSHLLKMSEAQQERINEVNKLLAETKSELMTELERTIKQCISGESLGILAKVESQSSSNDNSLTLIACQVYDTVGEIQSSLKKATSAVA